MPVPPASGSRPRAIGKAGPDVTIGIIAALPVEGAAMGALISDLEPVLIEGDPNNYRVGYLDSAEHGRPHRVVLTTMPQDNTRNAAAVCTDLIRTFTGVRCVVMTGIAGGIPSPGRPERHVRLGDVVVAMEGIVDYGHVRVVDGASRLRRFVDGISIEMIRAARELELREYENDRGQLWAQWLTPARELPMAVFERPPRSTDRLYVGGKAATHPDPAASGHTGDRPKVHYGTVGCADVLLRDERRRDQLAAEYSIVAVEMEGSGIATGAVLHGVHWFMVRGIADYCENTGKNDRWHPYASMAAAAYVRAVLQACRPFPVLRVQPRSGVIALLHDDERVRLFTLLGQVPELDARELWQSTMSELTPLPSMAPATVHELVDHLAGVNADADGVPPALALVEAIAERVGPDLAAGLRHWTEEVAGRLQIVDLVRRHRRSAAGDGGRPPGTGGDVATPDRPGAIRPCLVIQIVPDGIDRERCVISYWIQYRSGAWRPEPGGDPRPTLLSRAEAVVESAVRHAETAWRETSDQVAVEFLLPTQLLHLAVEWWRIELESAAPSPLCLDYPVVVRSLDRMRAGYRHRAWTRRWNALWHDPPAHHLYWGRAGDAGTDVTHWNTRLRDDGAVTSVVLSASPQDEAGRVELELALGAGVPVILWDRRERLQEETVELIKDLTRGHPDELPTRLHRLRANAAKTPGREQQAHPGRHLALLWDDPYRPVEATGPER
jgi:nucleoside phosphorylase